MHRRLAAAVHALVVWADWLSTTGAVAINLRDGSMKNEPLHAGSGPGQEAWHRFGEDQPESQAGHLAVVFANAMGAGRGCDAGDVWRDFLHPVIQIGLDRGKPS